MLVSERLMFLAKYAEFLRLRDECCNNAGPDNLEGAARAAELLLFLVNSEWSPRFFVVRLLEDAVQLLGDDNLVPQNIAYLQRLMACLQVGASIMKLLLKQNTQHSFFIIIKH